MKSNPCARTCRKRDEKAKEEHLATLAIKSISRYSRRCENTPLKYWQFKKENGRHPSHIISLNENHLGHSDILTPDMIGISKDVLIVHCDCNNRGGGIALIVNKNPNPKQIRMNTILELFL